MGIFEIISPFESLHLLCWNSNLEYFLFNLFILDYFGLFSFRFRLSFHLDLTVKSGDTKRLALINIPLRVSLDIYGTVN